MLNHELTPRIRVRRKTFPPRVRFDVFERDNFTCRYCGAKPPDVVLEVDHIIPISRGGLHCIENFGTACAHAGQRRRYGVSKIPLPPPCGPCGPESSCNAMQLAVMSQTGHAAKGISWQLFIQMATGKQSEALVYRTAAGYAGHVMKLAFCPWCGTKLAQRGCEDEVVDVSSLAEINVTGDPQ